MNDLNILKVNLESHRYVIKFLLTIECVDHLVRNTFFREGSFNSIFHYFTDLTF